MRNVFIALTVFLLNSCTQPLKLGKESKSRPPTVDLRAIGNQVLQEDSDALTIPFKIGGKNTEPEKTIFQTTSSNTAILETPRVKYDKEMHDYVLILTPVANKFGEVKVMVRVNNGFEDQRKEFSVLVESINDLPVVYGPAEVKFRVGEIPKKEISFSLNDVETPPEQIETYLEFTQEALFPPGAFEISPESNGRNRTVIFHKAPQTPGNAFLKIFAKDADNGIGLFAVHVVVERGVNEGPKLSGIPSNLRIPAGKKSPTITVNFSDDTSTDLGLSFSAYSKNTELIPLKNILTSGSGFKRDVVIEGPQGKKGITKVVFELSDGKSKTIQEVDVEIY